MSRQAYLESRLADFKSNSERYTAALVQLHDYIGANLPNSGQRQMTQSLLLCVRELVIDMPKIVAQLQSFSHTTGVKTKDGILRTRQTLSNGAQMAYHIGGFFGNDNAVAAFPNMIAETCQCCEDLLKLQGPWPDKSVQKKAIAIFVSLIKDSDKGCMDERLGPALHFVRTAMQTGKLALPFNSLGLEVGLNVVAARQRLSNALKLWGVPVKFASGEVKPFKYEQTCKKIIANAGLSHQSEENSAKIQQLWGSVLLDLFRGVKQFKDPSRDDQLLLYFPSEIALEEVQLAFFTLATYLSTQANPSLHIDPTSLVVIAPQYGSHAPQYGSHVIAVTVGQFKELEVALKNPIPPLQPAVNTLGSSYLSVFSQGVPRQAETSFAALDLEAGVDVVSARQVFNNVSNLLGMPVQFPQGWRDKKDAEERPFEYTDLVSFIYSCTGLLGDGDENELWKTLISQLFSQVSSGHDHVFHKPALFFASAVNKENVELAFLVLATYLSTLQDPALHITASKLAVLTRSGNQHYFMVTAEQIQALATVLGTAIPAQQPSAVAPHFVAPGNSVLSRIFPSIQQQYFDKCSGVYPEIHFPGQQFFKCVFNTQADADAALHKIKTYMFATGDQSIVRAQVITERQQSGGLIYRFFLSSNQMLLLDKGMAASQAAAVGQASAAIPLVTIDQVNSALTHSHVSQIGVIGASLFLGLIFIDRQKAVEALALIKPFLRARNPGLRINDARIEKTHTGFQFLLSVNQLRELLSAKGSQLPQHVMSQLSVLGLEQFVKTAAQFVNLTPSAKRKNSDDSAGAAAAAASSAPANVVSMFKPAAASANPVAKFIALINQAYNIQPTSSGDIKVSFKKAGVGKNQLVEALATLAITPKDISDKHTLFSITLSKADVNNLQQQGVNFAQYLTGLAKAKM